MNYVSPSFVIFFIFAVIAVAPVLVARTIMNEALKMAASAMNRQIVMLLRLALMVPLIGIWIFDRSQNWTTAFGTSRENGLLILSLIGEIGAILAAFATFAQPRRPSSIVVNIAILVTCTTSYLWGFVSGLWMGMEPGTAILFTITVLALAVVIGLVLRRHVQKTKLAAF